MTVVAWDGCTLAADTALMSGEANLIATVCKIKRIDLNSWLAFAGTPEGASRVASWIDVGMPEKEKGDLECEWILIRGGVASIGTKYNLEFT